MEQTKISSHQGTQPAHTTRAKPTAQQGTDTNEAGGSGGFLALLATLGGMSEGVVVTDTPASDLLPADTADGAAVATLDLSTVAAWQGLMVPPQSEAPTAQEGLPGESDLRPDAMFGGLNLLNTQAGNVSGDPALNDLALGRLSHGLVAETTKLDTAADVKDAQLQGTVAGFGRVFSRTQSALAQRSGGTSGGELSAGSVVAGDSTQRLSVIHGASSGAAALGQVASERSLSGQPHAGGSSSDRGVSLSGATSGAEWSTSVVDGVLSAVASSRGGESSGGSRPSEGHAGGGSWSDGGGAASPLEAGNVDNASVFSDASPMANEEQVADQVAYWVNQKTQNAEITLDRDGQPVEVSVSLSGNEAHVAFRSDQPQTRELLDQSMAQLRDLLRSEGLILSGMSVGTSARDGAASKDGESDQSRQRAGGRQAQVIASAPVGTASLNRSGGNSERAVDIFV